MDGSLEIKGVPLYADARHFYEAGVPVVMFGAGPKTLLEANGHRADEHVRIDDLVKAAKIVALTLYDLLKK
jgi:acetylornithine deacetylase/succinyl-diaminopimelate desuccinylase-like protein